jgi:hypothetical protein
VRWLGGAGVALSLVAAVPSGAEVSAAPSACAAAIAAPGAGAALSVLPPLGAAAPAPEQIVVCVGPAAITGASYAHWLIVAERTAGSPAKGEHAPTAADLRTEVLEFLIGAQWVSSEAAAQGIHVRAALVKHEFDRIRSQQFPKRSDFRAFLRFSGQTVADLLMRVEQSLLSRRLLARVVAGHRSPGSKVRAERSFLKAFHAHWLAQTYCAAGFVIAECGHAL